jgi:hypothetical protein
MKNLYALLLSFFFVSGLFAQKNTAIVNNGSWRNDATWSLNHTPVGGETVEIPAGLSVQVLDNINLSGSDIIIQIAGSLDFGNGKLALGSASKISLTENATIRSITGSNNNKISIGNVEKYNGSQGTLTGPLIASNITGVAPGGFMAAEPVVLPVKFASFSLSTQNNSVLVKWSTAQEVDAAYFEVQRSNNGSTWISIGRVTAAGNSNQLTQYQFTDANPQTGTMYYRIKQADNNGKAMFTTVQAIAATGVKPVHIFSTSQTVAVQFGEPVKGKMEVLVINRVGQVMTRQLVEPGASQVVLNGTSNFKGAYFVTVTNGTGIIATQQVIY